MSGSPCSNAEYKPLSSSVTDFIAESMCGILDTHQPPRCYNWDFVPLPELVLFVKKVTARAKIDVQTAIAALILVARFKERLPKNAHGEYGTTHKIFLSALLIALKEFMSKSHEVDYDDEDGCRPYSSAPPTCCSSPTPADELPPNSNLLDDSSSNYSSSTFSNSPPTDFDHSHNILSTTPSSTTSSMMSDDDVHDMLSNNTSSHRKNRRHNTINQRLAEISGIYTLQEVNQMERDFLKYLGHHNNWVSDKDIRDFVENNKYALGIC